MSDISVITQDNVQIVNAVVSIPGSKGDKGDTGDQGPQGIQGIQGLKGDTGDQGPQGIQGLKGDKGDTGDQGPQGLQGLKGDTGDQGPQGIQGLKGDTGDTGPQGPQGATGPQGAPGADGVGVPAGGTVGQALTKNSSTNYDTGWSNVVARAVSNLNLYVRDDGNDANTGSADTSGAAFLTIQKALNVLSEINLGRYTANVWCRGTFTVTSALAYTGWQGPQITVRAIADPTTLPNALALSGTKATDEATVRGNHSAIVETSLNSPIVNQSAGGSINWRGIAFIQTGAHAQQVVLINHAVRSDLTRCAMFGGSSGSFRSVGGYVTLTNCLMAHSAWGGLIDGACRIVTSSCASRYCSSNAFNVTGGSRWADTSSTMSVSASVPSISVARDTLADLTSTTVDGGTVGISLLDSTAQLTSCTWSGASTRCVFADRASRANVSGGTILSGATEFRADYRSSIRILSAPSGSPTYSPAINTVGNNEAYIA